ncbi:heavy-metal-associated domain-containing protein [Paeniglutamicibacter gangotriensis]|uniref:Heavy metal transport/detoxification protein n=2 Tax=Paeniglutamicibacter gangotriensis TaxID=254787 RepID=M7NAZ0_9MICC|nr:heavy-metal-associated domain-containing protein [Paeniglutamicibacter gangotriensis]EMQ98969.1 Heavy metal transport/detoxification protein [Paeniglutamicibacter gangotriensis Lz1y]KAA0974303.1 heavy-metal-associated domain-containing protein [Paeniglutamicibacter gangotriensis]
MATVKIETEPFACPSCIKKTEGVVGKLPGVESTQGMFNSNKIKVSYDDELVKAEDIDKTISDLGYPVLSPKVS